MLINFMDQVHLQKLCIIKMPVTPQNFLGRVYQENVAIFLVSEEPIHLHLGIQDSIIYILNGLIDCVLVYCIVHIILTIFIDKPPTGANSGPGNCTSSLSSYHCQDLTLQHKRRMSQRQKRTRSNTGTQTDAIPPNSPAISAGSRTSCSSSRDDLGSEAGELGEFYEDPSSLYERLVKAEEVLSYFESLSNESSWLDSGHKIPISFP
jgi:hypothetical protein